MKLPLTTKARLWLCFIAICPTLGSWETRQRLLRPPCGVQKFLAPGHVDLLTSAVIASGRISAFLATVVDGSLLGARILRYQNLCLVLV